MPGHHSRGPVTAKLALIGRAFAAGLERQVTAPQGHQAIVVIADFVLEHADHVDEVIAPLGTVGEPLDAEAMAVIIEQHGRFKRRGSLG